MLIGSQNALNLFKTCTILKIWLQKYYFFFIYTTFRAIFLQKLPKKIIFAKLS